MLESDDVVGRSLGNYRLLEVLGQGGMGVVYRGEHALLGRKAAIKVLRTELSRRADIVARFFNEARATSQVSHPSIVGCIDFGHDRGGSAYIVMELLEGENLRDRLDRQERIPWTAAVTIARQVASALGAAHELGVVHRDLKPDNIFLVEDADVVGGERAKVLDFGIAKLAGDSGVESVFRTRTGSLIGTPVYMSPEQCRGAGRVDERSDIYSLGCVLYQMVCGSPPFVAEGYGDLITMHITMPPKPPCMLEPTVPGWLDRVILTMLAKNPDDRYDDMEEVIADLDRHGGLPAPARARSPAGRVAVGTPAPPTTLGLSTAERVFATPVERPARLWLWPLFIGLVMIAGAVAFALAAGGEEHAAPGAAARPLEAQATPDETAVAVETPPAPPPAAAMAAEVADTAPVSPASADPPAARPAARSKRKKAREPLARPDRPSTRVRGGIAEPEL